MSLRAELLAAAEAQRDTVLASFNVRREHDRELRAVARREWSLLVDKLASGGPYRLLRSELPTGHPQRREGARGDVLVLVGDELKRIA